MLELLIAFGIYEELSSADIRDFIRDCGLEDTIIQKWASEITNSEDNEDAVASLIREYFLHFKMRANLMGQHYPFLVSNDLLRPKEGVVANESAYLFLVSCSRLDLLNGSIRTRAGIYFEVIAADAAKMIFGDSFSVHRLGSSKSMNYRVFSANKEKMIKGLARWFNHPLDEEYYEDARGISGDHGVDIVGRLRCDRMAKGSIAFLGQCAASADDNYWKRKRTDADKIVEVIRFSVRPTVCLFIPLLYRSLGGGWHNLTGLSKVFVVDRYRMKPVLSVGMDASGRALIDEIQRVYSKELSERPTPPTA